MPLGVLQESSKISQILQGGTLAEPMLKVTTWNSLKKKQSKSYSGNFIKKEAPTQRILHKYFPVSFGKIMNMNLNTTVRLPLK